MEEVFDSSLAADYAMTIVLDFIKALNKEDYKKARTFLSDYVIFTGVLTSRNGAANYLQDLERMKIKYAIKKVFMEGSDICLIYDLTISGLSIYACGVYEVVAGKIGAVRMVYDPRQVLDLIPA